MENSERKHGLSKDLAMTLLIVLFFISLTYLVTGTFRFLQVSNTLDWGRTSSVAEADQKEMQRLKTATQLRICLSGASTFISSVAILYLRHQGNWFRRRAGANGGGVQTGRGGAV
jgi:hypothetical protein